jgi:phosphopantothenoylcysteine decarboxylase/phosphopantothenate--cysteine ligase
MLKGKRIVIGITGSIAAYKIPMLVRLLKKDGAEVKVMMTEAAVDFVTPLTLSTLSENPVLIKPFDPEDGSWNSHVELGRWADLYVLAPVSANTLAKMASGITDNFFMAAYLSARCPVMFAPAMDLDMYKHPSTLKNIETLKSFGNILISPATGELASGLYGEGRMEEPEEIFNSIQEILSGTPELKGTRVLVTAGPTLEPIDPVRYIGNHSSGKMGYALAESFLAKGANVTLVSGPVSDIPLHPDIKRINVVTADEMHKVVLSEAADNEIIVMAAAVADFRPKAIANEKIKKSGKALSLELEPTVDILHELGVKKKTGQYLAGFALETEKGEENAKNKLSAKNLDMIVLNSLKDEGAGFGTDTNKVTIFSRSGETVSFGLAVKTKIADNIVNTIIKDLQRKS